MSLRLPAGANFVIAAIILYRLWPSRSRTASRFLVLITIFIISSCTAHVFIYLDDLLVGFTSSQVANALDNGSNSTLSVSEYFIGFRFNILVGYFLRVFNGFCNKLFVTWRVYVLWEHHAYLAALLLTVHFAEAGLNIAYGYHAIQAHILEDHLTKVLVASAWALSMVAMGSGLLLIAWRTIGTPKVVRGNQKRDGIFLKLFYVLVESGCVTLVADIVTVALGYHDQIRGFVSLAVLGQISALGPLAIILREISKAQQEASSGDVNVASALTLQISDHTLPLHRAQQSHNRSESRAGSSEVLTVRIERSLLEDDGTTRAPAIKQVFL
ncbi:unnamed protein product [Peniophora sp. CBMAI 1063]|nr:unnamed protein product [Peniophora sp. CBMAI 1063]